MSAGPIALLLAGGGEGAHTFLGLPYPFWQTLNLLAFLGLLVWLLRKPLVQFFQNRRTQVADAKINNQAVQARDLLLALAREQESPAAAPDTTVLPLLERVVVEQSPWLEGKPVEVSVNVATDLGSALPAPVLQVLLANLVGNAFAHTRAGRIAITGHGDALRIANPGSAVGEHDFAPFAKGEESTGFGLGLSIVRRLCALYGWDVQVRPGDTRGVVATLRFG